MSERIALYDDDIGEVLYIDHMGNDKRIVDAARVSFGRDLTTEDFSDRDKKLLKFLMREKHTSPFEHCSLTLRLKVPLFVARQIMRHRTFSYNEISRRYTEVDISLFEFSDLRYQSHQNLQCSDGQLDEYASSQARELINELSQSCLMVYRTLLEVGIAREQARAILPQSLYTEFYMSGNLLNWLKFVQLRDTEHAQPETRRVAQAVLSLLDDLYPATIQAWRDLRL